MGNQKPMFSTSHSNRRLSVIALVISATCYGIGCSQAPPPLQSKYSPQAGPSSNPFLVVRFIELSKMRDRSNDQGKLVAVAIWTDLTVMKVESMNLHVTRLTVGHIDRAQLDHVESDITQNWSELRKLENTSVPYDIDYQMMIFRSTFGRRYQFTTYSLSSNPAADNAAERLAQYVRQLDIRDPKSSLTDQEPHYLH